MNTTSTVNAGLPDAARVRWQCRRGMLELDILLLSFFDTAYGSLSGEKQKIFVELLSNTDQTLYQWLIGKEKPSSPGLASMVQAIRERPWKE